MASIATDWQKEISELGSSEHIEAVGALALFYNRLEFSLYLLMKHFVSFDEEARVQLFTTLNNRERVDLILALASGAEPAARDTITHAMGCYDICAENRNLVLHALPGMDTSNPSVLNVLKASKHKPNVLRRYHFTLDVIRRAALDMETTTDFIDRVWMVISEYVQDGQRVLHTLPEKPPKPRKLSLSQLEEDQPNG